MDKEKDEFPLPNQYQDLVRVIGLEATIRLCREYGGTDTYIPKVDGLLAAKQREIIRREWNGCNGEALARKYGVSARWIRKIVEGDKNPAIPGQMSVEDFL